VDKTRGKGGYRVEEDKDEKRETGSSVAEDGRLMLMLISQADMRRIETSVRKIMREDLQSRRSHFVTSSLLSL
jgi:hypothetical protein